MTVLAVIFDPAQIRKIIACMARQGRGPPAPEWSGSQVGFPGGSGVGRCFSMRDEHAQRFAGSWNMGREPCSKASIRRSMLTVRL
jgi:hypothetical protein